MTSVEACPVGLRAPIKDLEARFATFGASLGKLRVSGSRLHVLTSELKASLDKLRERHTKLRASRSKSRGSFRELYGLRVEPGP